MPDAELLSLAVDGRMAEREVLRQQVTSNLGTASSHDNRNMPVVHAGGGFRHGQHLAFDRSDNYPLPNLYVSLLQCLGLETDRFASGTSTLTGL